MANKLRETNTGFIKQMGELGKQVKDFATIRSWGDKNSAVTFEGNRVERTDAIYCDGYGWVKTLPTTMHFVYFDPLCRTDSPKKIGRWPLMCTCGSMAGIVSYDELKGLITMEQTGYLLCCVMALANKQSPEVGKFKHADGSTE